MHIGTDLLESTSLLTLCQSLYVVFVRCLPSVSRSGLGHMHLHSANQLCCCVGTTVGSDSTFTARKQPRLESSVDVHHLAQADLASTNGIAAAPQAAGSTPQTDGTTALSDSGPNSAVDSMAAAVELRDTDGVVAAIDDRDPGPKPYLCTGFDCYLVREPCVMCAMALVHSRVRRVVYAEADPKWGALGGSLRLHGQRSLNHHYTVYHMPRTQS